LFASIQEGTYGQELWSTTLTLLPLHLLKFSGQLVNGDGLLQWNTTGEQNTSHFVIERSTNARQFTSIGTTAASNLPGSHTYTFTDPNISRLYIPVVYYRLKMVDADGSFSYSNIVGLHMDNDNPRVLLFPNPASDKTTIRFTAAKPGPLMIQVSDYTGRIMIIHRAIFSGGSNNILLSVADLSPGMYTVRVNCEGVVSYSSFVKQ
jgi:trimeric autotransporter adhesin